MSGPAWSNHNFTYSSFKLWSLWWFENGTDFERFCFWSDCLDYLHLLILMMSFCWTLLFFTQSLDSQASFYEWWWQSRLQTDSVLIPPIVTVLLAPHDPFVLQDNYTGYLRSHEYYKHEPWALSLLVRLLWLLGLSSPYLDAFLSIIFSQLSVVDLEHYCSWTFVSTILRSFKTILTCHHY